MRWLEGEGVAEVESTFWLSITLTRYKLGWMGPGLMWPCLGTRASNCSESSSTLCA